MRSKHILNHHFSLERRERESKRNKKERKENLNCLSNIIMAISSCSFIWCFIENVLEKWIGTTSKKKNSKFLLTSFCNFVEWGLQQKIKFLFSSSLFYFFKFEKRNLFDAIDYIQFRTILNQQS